MSIIARTVLITGATGGIGREIARQLAMRRVSLILTGRRTAELDALAYELRDTGSSIRVLVGDLGRPDEPRRIARDATINGQGVDILINCAGVQDFGLFASLPDREIAQMFDVNVVAPMALVRALLPHMLERGSGRIVNVGSIFGSIGFPCFATYSATKFAIRGFSEALRRELAGTGVSVTYVAPRFTRTAMNQGPAARMATALKLNQDDPAQVAASVIREIERRGADRYLGWPEKFFVRLNAILPRLVDGALIKQSRRMSSFSES